MQIFNGNIVCNHITNLKELPIYIEFFPNKPSVANFKDGSSCSLSCLKCKNPMCIKYNNAELKFNVLPNFSLDTNNNVCPVNAITWDSNNDCPTIDKNKCIKCGLCIKRCPTGSLYFDKEVKVNLKISSKQTIVDSNSINETKQLEQISELINVDKKGFFILESKDLLNEIYNKLEELRNDYHNLIVRNILLGLNCKCAIRRTGDVYTRMDAIYSSENSIGAIEIEYGRDTLDASRGILDDIAVLNTRYGISKKQNNPLVVCLQLPNVRQGYWQVVKDINNVEGVKINTITIGALLVLLWNNKSLDLSKNSFYADFCNMDISKNVETILGRKIKLEDNYLGIFEPIK